MKQYVIYRNNVDYPFKSIVINEEDIEIPKQSGLLMYYNNRKKKYVLANNNKCDISTGGIFAGELKVYE